MKSSLRTLSLVTLLFGVLAMVVVSAIRAQEDKKPAAAGEDKPAAGDVKPAPAGEDKPAAADDDLLKALRQLQEEVQALRREVQELRGQRERRDGDAPREDGPRDGERRVDDPRPTQVGRIFDAYDKDKDRKVSFEEWLKMREGEITPERRIQEQMRFSAADTARDGGLTFDEFAFWMENRGRIPEGNLRGDFIAFDETQYTLLVKLVGRSGEGGVSTPDGEKTFNVARDVVILLEQGEPGKFSDLTESAPVQLHLSIDGKQVIAIQRIRKQR
jgi:hypothetical protein